MLSLGIDIGTSGVRTAVVAADGAVLSMEQGGSDVSCCGKGIDEEEKAKIESLGGLEKLELNVQAFVGKVAALKRHEAGRMAGEAQGADLDLFRVACADRRRRKAHRGGAAHQAKRAASCDIYHVKSPSE